MTIAPAAIIIPMPAHTPTDKPVPPPDDDESVRAVTNVDEEVEVITIDNGREGLGGVCMTRTEILGRGDTVWLRVGRRLGLPDSEIVADSLTGLLVDDPDMLSKAAGDDVAVNVTVAEGELLNEGDTEEVHD
jgi:hypothetical protein